MRDVRCDGDEERYHKRELCTVRVSRSGLRRARDGRDKERYMLYQGAPCTLSLTLAGASTAHGAIPVPPFLHVTFVGK